MPGVLVTAHSKEVATTDFPCVAQVHILRELARIGVAAVINSDPRKLYHMSYIIVKK